MPLAPAFLQGTLVSFILPGRQRRRIIEADLPFALNEIQVGETSMKFVRYGAPGKEKPGLIDADGKIRDLSKVVKDIDVDMLASGGLAKIKKANIKRLKPGSGKPRLGRAVAKAGN